MRFNTLRIMHKEMYNFCLIVGSLQLLLIDVAIASDTKINNGSQNDLPKEKRGVNGVVDTVQGVHGHNTGVGPHNIIPVAVPVHVPVPRPYPVGIPKPIGVPIGVPVTVRIAVPRPYPVPVILDPAASGYGYGLGLYGHTPSVDYLPTGLNHFLNYLTKSSHDHNHLGHLHGHDQYHSPPHLALSRFIH